MWSKEIGARAQRLNIDDESAKWLMRRHGARVGKVFDIVEESRHQAARIVTDLPFIFADLLLCARDEMALHLSDLLRRRMPLMILARLGAGRSCGILAELVAPAMGWDEDRVTQEAEACAL